MNDTVIFISHALLIFSLFLIALRLGKEGGIAYLSLLSVLMDFFVLKQVNCFNFNITAAEPLAVGYLFGISLLQEFFGKVAARKAVAISFFTTLCFVVFSEIHLAYIPNEYDTTHVYFTSLLRPLPRLVFASLLSFFVVQAADLSLFSFLRQKTKGKYLPLRMLATLFLSTLLDTLIFSLVGLWSQMGSLVEIIIFSTFVKLIASCCTLPLSLLAKKLQPRYETLPV